MTKQNKIQLFEEKKVRTVWNEEQEEWYFPIVDMIEVLTGSPNPRKYWSVLKTRPKKAVSQLSTNCSQLKMQSLDGKYYKTDGGNIAKEARLNLEAETKKKVVSPLNAKNIRSIESKIDDEE